jgi:hypothetical protein
MASARAIGVLLLTLTFVACGPSDANLLTDPRQILGQTIAATTPIKSVRVRFDLAYQSSPPDGQIGQRRQEGGWLEANVDFGSQAVSARGAAIDGTGQFEGVLTGNALYSKTMGNGRWSKTTLPAGMGMNPIGLFAGGGLGRQGPDIQGTLAAALTDNAIDVQLRGVEDCRTGRCYRTEVTIPPAKVWELAMKLTGADRLGGGAAQQPPEGDIPAITIQLLIDTKTLWLIDAVGSGSAKGNSASVRVQLADHNVPVVIQPPNPALVDDQGGFGFGLPDGGDCMNPDGSPCQIIKQVGSEISPEPS